MSIDSRIAALRQLMQQRGMSVYIVPTADDHASEYVGEHFKSRQFITGFTGSAGTAVITMEEAGLWTDGRYFVQAEQQLEGTEIKLFKMREPDVPKVSEYIESVLPEGGIIGFDGGCMPAKDYRKYKAIAEGKGGAIAMDEDLIGMLWEGRPALSTKPVWPLRSKYSGKYASAKIADIRAKMADLGCDIHLIASMYDIAWITNLRGNDIKNVPVFTSFMLITAEAVNLYCFSANWPDEVKENMAKAGVTIKEYGVIYNELPELCRGKNGILLDESTVNAKLLAAVESSGIKITNAANPSELMRSIKNETEILNTIQAHIQDGVAVTKFIKFVKENVKRGHLTELSAANELRRLREGRPEFLDLSFDTICAYGANAAMMHYSATPESFADIEPEGFLLVDSGGHYLGGTTDITRTIALGHLSQEMKLMYTKVLQGHLRLAHAKFPKGVSGYNLDVLARQPLWAMGLDYRCGTGHGVGHILNVHEGPNAFRWRAEELSAIQELLPGMITTDEPGYYEEGAYGIRIENELLCIEGDVTDYGQFYQFQNITYAPIDLEPVLPELLTEEEREWLNSYHEMVRIILAPYLDDEERDWLEDETRAI